VIKANSGKLNSYSITGAYITHIQMIWQFSLVCVFCVCVLVTVFAVNL